MLLFLNCAVQNNIPSDDFCCFPFEMIKLLLIISSIFSKGFLLTCAAFLKTARASLFFPTAINHLGDSGMHLRNYIE